MNKATTNRLISFQECMVLLGRLKLTSCSERIETVSISNSSSFKFDGENVKKSQSTKYIFSSYKTRPPEEENLSLYDHWMKNNPEKIPHFVGISGRPVFPITDLFARQVCIVHIPWRDYPRNLNWKEEFYHYINSGNAAESVSITYARILQRFLQRMSYYDPVTAKVDHTGNPVPDDVKLLMDIMGRPDVSDFEMDSVDRRLHAAPKGHERDWSVRTVVSIPSITVWLIVLLVDRL